MNRKIILLFSVFVMCTIILGCNREYFLDNTQIDTETVMTSEEQSESSIHLVNNTTSEIIWTEMIFVAKKRYEIIFERVGNLCKENKSDSLGLLSDYQIMVRSEEGEVLQTLGIKDYPIRYENVHWIKDISQDGFSDIILCTDFINMPHCSTRLLFLIWDEEKKMYEYRNLPKEYIRNPIWNEELGTIMFWEEGSNAWIENMKMYRYNIEDWELYGEIILENNEDIPNFTDAFQEEIYYKELTYTVKEIFYEAGEVIQVNVYEKNPWWNSDSIWYLDNKKNKLLFPHPQDGWKVETLLDNGETVWKYVRGYPDVD